MKEKSVCKVNSLGDKIWYLYERIHRGNDLPAIEYADGTKAWYLNNKIHRDNDLPAVEWKDGVKVWYINDYIHRMTGPAIEYSDGSKAWYINGEHIDCNSQKEFNKYLMLLAFK